MNYNQENPTTFEQARVELGPPGQPISAYRLTALKKACGIRSRVFMLSIIRNFLVLNPGWTTTDVYPNHRKPSRGFYLRIQPEGKHWVVTMTGVPDVMAEDKNLPKALAVAAEQFQKFHKAA